MATMIVKFEWDENDLGPFWFNEDNLKVLLFSNAHTRSKFLNVECLPITLVNEPESVPSASVGF